MRAAITGSRGQVGRALRRLLPDAEPVERDSIAAVRADVVFHCAAWTDVDGCERDPNEAMRANAELTREVAKLDARVVYLSTDYVFDGTKPAPYVESDAPNPINAYGSSKLAGETALRDTDAIVRASWICAPGGTNIVNTIRRLAAGDKPLRFATDQRACVTLADDLAPMLVRIADEGRTGVWHVANQGAVSPFELAQEVLSRVGADPARVEPIVAADLGRPARRPSNSVLASERLTSDELLPDWRDSPALAPLLEPA
jgi:dTDP-4-dehydrorhamnose reductase